MDKTTANNTVATIGIDLAKKVFHVHAIDSSGKVVIRRVVKRRELLPFAAKLPPCVIGMEACATAHHWARALGRLGHEVKLIPPAYVKAYVRRQKNDAADAAAEKRGQSPFSLDDLQKRIDGLPGRRRRSRSSPAAGAGDLRDRRASGPYAWRCERASGADLLAVVERKDEIRPTVARKGPVRP